MSPLEWYICVRISHLNWLGSHVNYHFNMWRENNIHTITHVWPVICSMVSSFLHINWKSPHWNWQFSHCHVTCHQLKCAFSHVNFHIVTRDLLFSHVISNFNMRRWSNATRALDIFTSDRLCTNYDISSIKHSVFPFAFSKVQMRSAFLGEMGIKISKRGNKTWVSSMFSHILTCWLAIWTNVLTCKNRWTSHVNIYTTNGHFWQTNSTFPNLNYICSLVIKCISSACDWHLNMRKCNDMWTEHVFWSVFAYEWQFSHQKVHIFGYE